MAGWWCQTKMTVEWGVFALTSRYVWTLSESPVRILTVTGARPPAPATAAAPPAGPSSLGRAGMAAPPPFAVTLRTGHLRPGPQDLGVRV